MTPPSAEEYVWVMVPRRIAQRTLDGMYVAHPEIVDGCREALARKGECWEMYRCGGCGELSDTPIAPHGSNRADGQGNEIQCGPDELVTVIPHE